MPRVTVSRQSFLGDRQGRTFADVANDSEQPFDDVLDFFNDEGRQRRMEESETHHDRPPLAGVVRELEAQTSVDAFLSSQHPRRTKRLRQAIGVVVRIIMEQLGWKKTGKKGSLGVRAKVSHGTATPGAYHNNAADWPSGSSGPSVTSAPIASRTQACEAGPGGSRSDRR